MDRLRTPASVTGYVNVFHIDHNENKLSISRASLADALAEFLSKRATYRITISMMGRQMSLDIVWEGRWSTITVKVV